MRPLYLKGFSGGSEGKVSAYNVGDPGSIPGSGRSPGAIVRVIIGLKFQIMENQC